MNSFEFDAIWHSVVGVKGTFFTLGVTYLALVWALSGVIRLVESRLAIPETS